MAALIGGPAAAWLAARREELNLRYQKAARRWSALDAASVKARLPSVLTPCFGDEPSSDALASSVYDLVLLHEGRGSFATKPALVTLLETGFARLRPHLLADPERLPGALSNAVEASGERGAAFVAGLVALSAPTPVGQLLLAGAVLAWRLGDVRLRTALLPKLEALDPAALLIALELDWPLHAAPLAIRGLEVDAWRSPRSWVKDSTLEDKLQTAQALSRLGEGPTRAQVVARLGDFAGFGGPFLRPPTLHEGGDRHRFLASDGETVWSLEGDTFGWLARRAPGTPSELPTRKPNDGSAVSRLVRRMTGGERDRLEADGTVHLGARAMPIPELSKASSYTIVDRTIAAAFPESHRVRIAVPVGDPL